LDVLESKDRLAYASSYGFDENGNRIMFNFWMDATNPKGIWRKVTMDQYKSDNPPWKTVLDVDALAEKDGISWVWKGSRALPRKRDPMSDNGRIVTRCLLSLSRGVSNNNNLIVIPFVSSDQSSHI
jgi:prolyl oligopeptidase